MATFLTIFRVFILVSYFASAYCMGRAFTYYHVPNPVVGIFCVCMALGVAAGMVIKTPPPAP